MHVRHGYRRGRPRESSEISRLWPASVAPRLHAMRSVPSPGAGSEHVRDRLERIVAAYEEMDRRFVAAGGLGSLLSLYEQVRTQLERISYEELDRMAVEIKTVIEALLKMDYEVRRIRTVKMAFEVRPGGADGSP